jgi:hypothetical protein
MLNAQGAGHDQVVSQPDEHAVLHDAARTPTAAGNCGASAMGPKRQSKIQVH